MSYNIFEGADVVQNDGTALVNSEIKINSGTVKNGGNLSDDSSFNSIDTVSTNRRKVNSRASVRTKKVEASIRAGDWNIFTGRFNNPVSVHNDFISFGVDEETVSANRSIGGEFSYRMGITTEVAKHRGKEEIVKANLNDIKINPYYIFESGAVANPYDPTGLTWATTSPGNDWDWSGVGIHKDISSNGTQWKGGGALITPLHLVVAKHDDNLGTYTFMDSSGVHHTREPTVAGTIDGSDITIFKMDSELPAGCKVYTVVTNHHLIPGHGTLSLQREHDIILMKLLYSEPTSAVGLLQSFQGLSGNGSGNPIMLPQSDGLMFLGTHAVGSGGPSVGYYKDEINAILALDGVQYKMKTSDPNIVPEYFL